MKKSTFQKIAILNAWLKVHFSSHLSLRINFFSGFKFFCILLFVLLTSENSWAGTKYYGGSGTWTGSVWSTTNGTPYTTAWVSGDAAVFNIANSTITGASTNFLSITATENVTVTAGGTLGTGGTVAPITVSSGKLFNFGSQAISVATGTGFIKDGTGTLSLNGAAYLGGFTLNAGTVLVGGVNALGNASLTINGGVIVSNSGSSKTPNISSITIGGNFQLGDAVNFPSNTGALIFPNTSAISLGASTRTITIGGTFGSTLGGIISGDAGVGLIINSSSTGSISLNGINTYSGPTTINSGAIIRLPATTASASPLGTTESGTTVNSGGNLELNSNRSTNQEPITINGDGISGGGAISNNVANSYADINGLVTLGSSSSIIAGSGTSQSIILRNTGTITGSGYNLTIGGGNAASTNTSQIYSIIGTGSGTLTKTGPGTWYLYGANTYTGLTSVTNGILILSKTGGGTLPATNNVAISGGTLRVSSNQTIANLDMSGNGSLVVDAGVTLTITGTYTSGSGTINNLGTIVLNGSSSQTFPGISMTVNNGTANTMANLTINNSIGVTIDKSITISGTLITAPLSKLTLLNSGISLTSGTFNIQSNISGAGTFVDNGGTLTTTTATSQQDLSVARNWYMSSSVSGAVSLPTVNTGTLTFYAYPENDANQATGANGYAAGAVWNTISSGTFDIGKGYIVKTDATNATVTFTGTSFNTGDKTITGLTYSATNPKSGFNLIGNPYPSYLNVLPSVNANLNLEPTVWYRTRDTNETPLYHFETVNTTTGVGTNASGTGRVTGYIPPMQSFWVRTAVNNQSITLSNTERLHATTVNMTGVGTVPTTTLKAPKSENQPYSLLGLYITNGITGDETILMFAPEAANSLDRYDSKKLGNNNASIPEIYTTVNTERLAINGMNSVPETELPLGFSAGKAGNFKIKVSELNNFDSNTHIYLLDKQENSETELTPETEYAFSTTATTSNNESRFSLLFKAPGVTTGTTNTEREQVSVFVNTQNQITIIAKPNSNYNIYNAVGQLIENGILNSELQTINCKLQTGIFVVKVNNQSTRVIVK